MKKQSGFTILELLITLVILGAVGFGAYNMGKNAGKKSVPAPTPAAQNDTKK